MSLPLCTSYSCFVMSRTKTERKVGASMGLAERLDAVLNPAELWKLVPSFANISIYETTGFCCCCCCCCFYAVVVTDLVQSSHWSHNIFSVNICCHLLYLTGQTEGRQSSIYSTRCADILSSHTALVFCHPTLAFPIFAETFLRFGFLC